MSFTGSHVSGEKLTYIDPTFAIFIWTLRPRAKNELGDKGYEFDMATPVVVAGKEHSITHQVDGKKMIMPFSNASDNLYLEMCFNK